MTPSEKRWLHHIRLFFLFQFQKTMYQRIPHSSSSVSTNCLSLQIDDELWLDGVEQRSRHGLSPANLCHRHRRQRARSMRSIRTGSHWLVSIQCEDTRGLAVPCDKSYQILKRQNSGLYRILFLSFEFRETHVQSAGILIRRISRSVYICLFSVVYFCTMNVFAGERWLGERRKSFSAHISFLLKFNNNNGNCHKFNEDDGIVSLSKDVWKRELCKSTDRLQRYTRTASGQVPDD